MSEPLHHALLPAGLPDMLPPDAGHEAAQIEQLVAMLASHGYERVKPPLAEFEESLLSGTGAALAHQAFRVMDPHTQRMMVTRPDMTPQVARIATTRLAHQPRPLRLAYAGEVLRIKGTQLRAERQFAQVGAELIGTFEPEADAEVILLAVRALHEIGVRDLSVDLCVPTLVPALCLAWGLSKDQTQILRLALDRKDAAAVAAVGGEPARLLEKLMAASGLAAMAMAKLEALDLPTEADPDRNRLRHAVRLLMPKLPSDLTITLDLVEYRGFEYQTGVSFSLFSRVVRGELGCGGRYRAGVERQKDGTIGEPATGFTLFTDTVMQAIPRPEPRQRVYIPAGSDLEQGQELRAKGLVTIAGLTWVSDNAAEARRLGCDHVLTDGINLQPVGPG
ncbi:MAG: ATP phosphoribosyltransferase regulatory subunit [Rhodospirillaceae bacterium]